MRGSYSKASSVYQVAEVTEARVSVVGVNEVLVKVVVVVMAGWDGGSTTDVVSRAVVGGGSHG